MLPGSTQFSFVNNGTHFFPPNSLQQFSGAVQIRDKMVVNKVPWWSVLQQAIPIVNEANGFYHLDNNLKTLVCAPYLMPQKLQREPQVIPAIVVHDVDNSWMRNNLLQSGRSVSSATSKYACPLLKSRQNSKELPSESLANRHEFKEMDHLWPSLSTDKTQILQREIELAAARTRIAMLEKVLFPRSFFHLQKTEENERKEKTGVKESSDKLKIDRDKQKEVGIQCQMSIEGTVSAQKTAKSDHSELHWSPRLPVYPKQTAVNTPASLPGNNSPGTIGADNSPPPMYQSPVKPTFKAVELIRAIPLGKDPAHGAGIGIIFQQTKLANKMIVSGLVPGGNAALSGRVNLGDVIHAIDGVPVAGRAIADVVAMIKGVEGSRVTVALQDYESNMRRVVLRREPASDRGSAPGEAVGVGVAIKASRPGSAGNIVVVGVMPGGSAARSGAVALGDIVHAIDGTPVQGQPIPEVVRRIKGRAGTDVVMHLESTSLQSPGLDAVSAHSSPSGVPRGPPPGSNTSPIGGFGSTLLAITPAAQQHQGESAGSPKRPLTQNLSQTIVAQNLSRPSRPLETRVTICGLPGQVGPDSETATASDSPTRMVEAAPAGLGPGGTKRVVLRRRALAPIAAGSGGPVALGGIGMSFVVSEGQHVVSQLAPNGSAQASGLVKVRDIILSVNDVPAYGKSIKELISEIVGLVDTEVVVLLQSDSGS
jgi:hypothetical protein